MMYFFLSYIQQQSTIFRHPATCKREEGWRGGQTRGWREGSGGGEGERGILGWVLMLMLMLKNECPSYLYLPGYLKFDSAMSLFQPQQTEEGEEDEGRGEV